MPGFLVATTLPHRDPGKATNFTRVNGNVETTLMGKREIGLPFGVYPRLIAIHLATGAVRKKSRKFHVGRSINELLRWMRISDSGGKGGPSTLARDQLDRLCATGFITTHGHKHGREMVTVADSWDPFLKKTDNGIEARVSERFYDQATEHAVPLDPLILRHVRRSPLSIDIYGWITERMSRLDEPAKITWPVLEKQFGSEYDRPRDFRRRFRQAVERVKDAWPGNLGIEVQDRRVLLDPGPPSVATRTERQDAKNE